MKMFLILSHVLTKEQIIDATNTFGVTEFVELPEKLKTIWSNIPPEIETLDGYLNPIFDYLLKNANKGDIALVSGDFGAVYKVVNFAKSIGILALYATTKREVFEVCENGEVKKISKFKHVRFREF